MERKVQLLDPQTQEPMKRVDFGSCYYGCNLTNLAILYNSSPESVDYVILLEQNGLGAEVVRMRGEPLTLLFVFGLILKVFPYSCLGSRA